MVPRPSSVFPNHHAVKFYPNDASLFTTVGGFLSLGLVDGQPALLVATESHLTGILDELRGRFIDVDRVVEVMHGVWTSPRRGERVPSRLHHGATDVQGTPEKDEPVHLLK